MPKPESRYCTYEMGLSNTLQVTTEAAVEATSKCPNFCGNGACDERTGLCDCSPGWRGDECHLCGGKIKLNGTGTLYNRKYFGLSFCLKNSLRFHFDSVSTFLNYCAHF